MTGNAYPSRPVGGNTLWALLAASLLGESPGPFRASRCCLKRQRPIHLFGSPLVYG
ncbi:hypothetical protein NITHO_50007 [Nitrolancea hollandica Lb]|uniref:Uncharacterized protein n=1 Tax=Nitrolancea hollandica Lb TaxID=1129897 RepID=I4EL96_9BACT|nr:hypothetical protein NITHO_50007 [Nitrolancea hollandica Lb]